MFTNFIGCDSERVYYDGSSIVAVNGDVVSELLSFIFHMKYKFVSFSISIAVWRYICVC